MTTDDILFGNNSNILVVDDATVTASIAASQLIVRVWHRQPRIEGERIIDDWIERLVPWNELFIDVDRFRCSREHGHIGAWPAAGATEGNKRGDLARRCGSG
jgi:hypothetical protein